MGRKRQRRELFVAMNGREVGLLERSAAGALSFTYSPRWRDGGAIPISLSMPLSPDPYSGDVVANFFDNLLPDNDDMRRRMQAQLETDTTQAFDLLSAAGADCVGALQLFGSPDMPDVRQVVATPVSEADIAEILRSYPQHPLGMTPERDDFRISIAGVQEKTAFLWHEKAWHRPQGPTPTSHVFKLPIGVAGTQGLDLSTSVENEWLCLKIAEAFGLPVPRAEIHRFEDVVVLVVERFDRQWSDDGSWLIRLPQEDMCQALGVPPGRKYEAHGGPGIADIMDILLQSAEPTRDRALFFRACVVNWLLAGIDGHAKNFSLSLFAGGRCMLTPFYDILSAHPFLASHQLEPKEAKMAMAVDGKNRHYAWPEIQGRHWLTTAKKCRFSETEAESILDACAALVDPVIEKVQRELPTGFPREVADPIFEGIATTRRKIAGGGG